MLLNKEKLKSINTFQLKDKLFTTQNNLYKPKFQENTLQDLKFNMLLVKPNMLQEEVNMLPETNMLQEINM
jgi:hypothetical protein